MSTPLAEPEVAAGAKGHASGIDDLCRVCGTSGRFPRFDLREMLFGTREVFVYVRCPTCGVMQLVDVPADLARHYPTDYWSAGTTSTTERSMRGRTRWLHRNRHSTVFSPSLLARLADRLSGPIAPFGRIGSFVHRAGLRSFDDPILDVGCGRVPENLGSLKDVGFRNLRGIDPFLDENRSWQGIPLERTSIHDCRGAFQLVMLHHSFEHAPDPRMVMSSIRRLLRPGGVAIIRTPVMGTWFWQTYRTNWIELDPPRHLFIHSTNSLLHCASVAGLRPRGVIWESEVWEIIASEQIAGDVAWREAGSWAVHPPAGFGRAVVESYRSQVAQLNRAGRAGRAAFYFEAEDHSA